jgi:DNA-binding transcriptional regulator YiaG
VTPAELQDTMRRLGLSQIGAASLLRVNVRTVRRWQDGDVPVPFAVAVVLRMLVDGRLTLRDISSSAGAVQHPL